MSSILELIICYISTHLLIIFFINKFENYYLDIPNQRSSHKIAKVRGAGICFVIPFIIFSIKRSYFMPLLSIPILIIGLIDDKRPVPNKYKFLLQSISGLLIFYFSSSIQNDNINLIYLITVLFLIFIYLTMVNFINFMDGLDLLVSGSMCIIFIFFTLTKNFNFIPLVGSLGAFLYWNWPPAKVFMGDAGSTFLGSIYGTIILNASSINEKISLILIISPLLLDSIITLSIRLIKRQNIFRPHKLHLYQRLNQAGWPHRKVSSIYALAILLLCTIYTYSSLTYLIISTLLVFLLGLYLNKYHAKTINI